MNNKTAIVCNTPYQIFNAINIVVNNIEGVTDADIFVIDCFSRSDVIVNKLIDVGIFNKVIVCKPKKIISNKFRTCIELCLAKKLFDRYMFSDLSFLENKYDDLFIGDSNELGIALYNMNKCKTIAFDDGVMSYSGNCFLDTPSWWYKKMGRLLHIGTYSYKIDSIYVNCKECCKSTVGPIKQLPILNEKNQAVKYVFDVFGYDKESKIDKYKYILLDQVLTERPGFNGKELDVLFEGNDILCEKGIIRKHPRKSNIEFDKISCDLINNMWELECFNKINEDSILIGAASTAQINPKIIAGKEPFIIFTYLLFFEANREFENAVEMTIKMYKDKDKIFVPKNLEEFKKIIDEFEGIE